MTKKNLLLIIVLAIIILIIVIYKLNLKDVKEITTNNTKSDISMENVEYDEDTKLYYLKDKKTGEIIGASYEKENLKFYIDNPDYNPVPLTSKSIDLNEFSVSSNENTEETLE